MANSEFSTALRITSFTHAFSVEMIHLQSLKGEKQKKGTEDKYSHK
jgi:hypothetical protein